MQIYCRNPVFATKNPSCFSRLFCFQEYGKFGKITNFKKQSAEKELSNNFVDKMLSLRLGLTRSKCVHITSFLV